MGTGTFLGLELVWGFSGGGDSKPIPLRSDGLRSWLKERPSSLSISASFNFIAACSSFAAWRSALACAFTRVASSLARRLISARSNL